MKIKCIMCGVEIEARRKDQKFCSNKCKSKYSYKKANGRKNTTQVCAYCGKLFHPLIRGKEQPFCSRECGVRGRKGKSKRSANGNNTNCSYCGKPLYRQPKRLKVKNVFCNRKCFYAFKRISLTGANNPNYRAISFKICIGCGKEYRSYDKNRRYCSTICAQTKSASEAMANLKKGLEAEIKCCKVLLNKGYHVSRSAGSKGEYDVIAISEKEILLIQVKCTKSKQLSRIFPKNAIKKLELSKCPYSGIIKKQLWSLVSNIEWYIKDI